MAYCVIRRLVLHASGTLVALDSHWQTQSAYLLTAPKHRVYCIGTSWLWVFVSMGISRVVGLYCWSVERYVIYASIVKWPIHHETWTMYRIFHTKCALSFYVLLCRGCEDLLHESISQCSSPISQNKPFCNRNVHSLLPNGAFRDIYLMHFGICDGSINSP